MNDHHINYIELISNDLEKTKQFYGNCFGWSFTDWGDTYISIDNAGIDGGFELGTPIHGTTRVILLSDDLEQSLETVTKHGATIVQDIFSFPGGRRFHFTDPSGNELAIWQKSAEH